MKKFGTLFPPFWVLRASEFDTIILGIVDLAFAKKYTSGLPVKIMTMLA